MAGHDITNLQGQELGQLIQSAGTADVLDQLRAATGESGPVVVLVVARNELSPDDPAARPAQADALTARATESGRRTGLARRRREVCKTQEGLAMDIGVERSTVARWEAGETRPSLWARPRLANALDITLDALDVLL
ncbi:helix-turn-helix transcriptional regulator [Myceligenerans xiligouense]|uniref:helix-turn-helix transcriptional regulator n=1 Tax=Myceligenerans xiligouense TaxID=253184 RepID=UPI000F4F1D52|nr:helix-turn-helix transcriptional regulator [Myceligenerans xiligouense]